MLPQEATEVCRAGERPGRSVALWLPSRACSPAQEPLSPATPAHMPRSTRPTSTGGRRTDPRVSLKRPKTQPSNRKPGPLWAGLTRHVGGAAAQHYDCCGRGANSGQCGQIPRPSRFFIFSCTVILLFTYVNTCVWHPHVSADGSGSQTRA